MRLDVKTHNSRTEICDDPAHPLLPRLLGAGHRWLKKFKEFVHLREEIGHGDAGKEADRRPGDGGGQ